MSFFLKSTFNQMWKIHALRGKVWGFPSTDDCQICPCGKQVLKILTGRKYKRKEKTFARPKGLQYIWILGHAQCYPRIWLANFTHGATNIFHNCNQNIYWPTKGKSKIYIINVFLAFRVDSVLYFSFGPDRPCSSSPTWPAQWKV